MRAISCFGLGMLVICGRSNAARPFDVDDAGTVAPGAFEAEFGSASWKDRAEFGLALEHGVTQRMDVGLAMDYSAVPSDERAFAPVELSAKWVFVPEMLAGTFTTSPASPEWSLNGIVSRSMGDFGANLNLGADFVEGGESGDLTWGVNPLWNIGAATLGSELLGDVDGAQLWRMGAQVRAGDRLAFDLAAGSTIDGDPEWTITAGIWGTFGASNGGH